MVVVFHSSIFFSNFFDDSKSCWNVVFGWCEKILVQIQVTWPRLGIQCLHRQNYSLETCGVMHGNQSNRNLTATALAMGEISSYELIWVYRTSNEFVF